MNKRIWVYLCILMIVSAGCGRRTNYDQIVKESDVALRCENVMSNGFLRYRIVEVWKNESGGRFKLTTNEFVQGGVLIKDNEFGPESLLIGAERGGVTYFHEVYPIKNGRISGFGNTMTVDKMRQKWLFEQFSR